MCGFASIPTSRPNLKSITYEIYSLPACNYPDESKFGFLSPSGSGRSSSWFFFSKGFNCQFISSSSWYSFWVLPPHETENADPAVGKARGTDARGDWVDRGDVFQS